MSNIFLTLIPTWQQANVPADALYLVGRFEENPQPCAAHVIESRAVQNDIYFASIDRDVALASRSLSTGDSGSVQLAPQCEDSLTLFLRFD